MRIINKLYTHYVEDNFPNLEVDLNNEIDYNLYVVYYINCFINNNYLDWLYNQIKSVIPFNGTIYIIASLDKNNERNFREFCLVNFKNCIVECNYNNHHEYSGILKVWELGQIHNKSNDIILYFHSKGISRTKSYRKNKNENYNLVIGDINLIKEIYTIFPKIDKIGYYSGGIGWIWYNFWYARGSYINKVEKPVKTDRRHYYEDWLARKIYNKEDNSNEEKPLSFYNNTLNSCYGIYSDKSTFGNIGSYYCPQQNHMINSNS